MSQSPRGRDAANPTQMPTKGWKDVLARVKDRFEAHRVTLVAGGLTYFLILSLFPGLAALVAIFGLVADPQTIQGMVGQLEGVVPSTVLEVLRSQLERLTSQTSSSLSIAFAVSVLLSLWSANKGVKALFTAMNIAYEEKDDRGFLKQNAVTLGFTLATMLLVVLALASVIVVPTVLSVVPLAPSTGWIVAAAAVAILAVAAVAWLGALFRVGPDRRGARASWLTPGAVVTFLGWIVLSAAFSFYASNLTNFDTTYGSFATVIVVLMWVWLMMISLLAGAEINAQLEHQTARDSTVGPERSPGSRDATMADRVARA